VAARIGGAIVRVHDGRDGVQRSEDNRTGRYHHRPRPDLRYLGCARVSDTVYRRAARTLVLVATYSASAPRQSYASVRRTASAGTGPAAAAGAKRRRGHRRASENPRLMAYLVSSRGRRECHAPTRRSCRASAPPSRFMRSRRLLAQLEATCAPAPAHVDIFRSVNILSESTHPVRRGRYGPKPLAYK